MRRRPIVLLLALLLLAAPASAWSYKEHVAFTRLAVQRLLADEATPDDLKTWLREVAPDAGDVGDVREFVVDGRMGPDPSGVRGLSYWAIHPDIDRSTPVPLFRTTEGPMHYVDLEFLNPDPDDQKYADDLSNLPAFDEIPMDPSAEVYEQAGYLPFRVAQCYEGLIESIRDGKLAPDADAERLDNALSWAGYLAHYLQDNTQPHHSTIDYKSLAYFPDAGRGQAPNVHGMTEYGFLDDGAMAYPDLRRDYFDALLARLDEWDRLAAEEPAAAEFLDLGDPVSSTFKVSYEAYGLLPLIGRAAQAAVEAGSAREPDLETFARFRLTVGGPSLLEAKADAGAVAVLRTERALRQAWEAAQ